MSTPPPSGSVWVGEGILAHPSGARSARIHEQVLVATADLLDEGGCAAATVDAISARSGVSKATLYKHWPSRTAIAAKAFGRMMASDTPLPDTGTTAGDLTEMVRRVSAFYASPRGRIFAQLVAACVGDPAGAPYFRAYFLAGRRAAITELWDRARARGDVDPDISTDDVIDILFGPLIFRLLTDHLDLTEENATRLAETALAGLLRPGVLSGGDREGGQVAQMGREVEHDDGFLLRRVGPGDHRDGVGPALVDRQVRGPGRDIEEVTGVQRRAAGQAGAVPDLDLAAGDPDSGLVTVVQVRRSARAGRDSDHVQAERPRARRRLADPRAEAEPLLPVVAPAGADHDAAALAAFAHPHNDAFAGALMTVSHDAPPQSVMTHD
jgi:AcrR family transcriptional regulator